MRRSLSIIAVTVALATPAFAFEFPAWIPDELDVTLHGRVVSVVEVDRESAVFPGNHASRSPQADSRAMASAETGSDRIGRLYLKGAAVWSEADDGVVRFEFEQGDYLWERSLSVRLFANERRYFTSSLGPALLDDDRVDRFDDNGGVRVEGAARERLSWSALGALLDDGTADMRRLGYATARWHGSHVQGALAYLSDRQPMDSLQYHTVVKGELAGVYRNTTLLLSYEQSDVGADAASLPDARFDWDGFDGSNFAASLSEEAAAFAEVRVGDVPMRAWGHVDLVYRYHATGDNFINDLAATPPGQVATTGGLYFRHRKAALDGRLVYEKRTQSRIGPIETERVIGQARALLKNGTEALLRVAVGHREYPVGGRANDNFIHAGVRRSMRKLQAGAHVMVKDIDDGEFDRRFAVDARINWSANISIYGRVLTNEDNGSHDAVFWRVELRPADHVFATVEYGRRSIGDAPYMLEDLDIGQSGATDSVYRFTVRGDF